MPHGREYELKFSIAPEAARRLVDHPVLRGAGPPPRRDRLVSTYYDTADGALRERRVVLRVREGGRTPVQTLKRSGASLVDRDEWEHEAAGRPDMAWLRGTPLGALFAEDAVAAGLDPRFVVDVRRTILPLAYDGTAIEGALDEGAILSGGKSLAVHELELEHKGGPSRGLVRLTRKLVRELPLVLSLSSKSERGFAVADASWGRPDKHIGVDLATVRTLADLFTAVLQGCLHALCRNAALIDGAADEEAVHKTRIALRHIRAALDLFRPVLRRRRLARVKSGLKWMSGRLGTARDADVFRTMAEADAPAVAEALEPHRRRAHERLGSALASARWRLLLVDLLAFSEDGIRRSRRDRRAAPFVRNRLRKLERRVARASRGMKRRSPEALHDLRKRAKMLRYDLDLVAGLPKLSLRRKHLRRTARDLHTLQQTLGTIHDGEAMGVRLDDSILSRNAPPKGIGEAPWGGIVRAARAMRKPTPDGSLLRDAARAGRRLRRRAS